MKKDVIIVPKDKCPLDVISELGEKAANSWIFLHKNAIEKLKETADEEYFISNFVCKLLWKETENYPQTMLRYDILKGVWTKIARIDADDIAFKCTSEDPDYIYFIKMEE